MNLQGNINLLKMNKACVVGVPTKQGGQIKGVFIPIVENDIYLTTDRETGKLNGALLSLNVVERREPSENGHTHYVKPSVGKELREKMPAEAEALSKVYLGNMKPFTFENNQAAAMNQITEVATPVDTSDLPF